LKFICFTILLIAAGTCCKAQYKGGGDDGYSLSVSDRPGSRGGMNDGYAFSYVLHQKCNTDTIVWLGKTDNIWLNNTNWSCSQLPGITSVVIIPSGMPRYPTLLVSIEIKSLILQPGASVTINTPVQLKINGH
jgi:hypothetical protein